MKDDGIRVEYQEGTLPHALDILDEALPLRWRELRITTRAPFASGVSVFVCEDGHVHLTLGPHSPLHIGLMSGLLAYTLARCLDTRPKLPKLPSLKVCERSIGDVYNALHCSGDTELALAYQQHVPRLKEWIDEYIVARGETPHFTQGGKRRGRARVAVGDVHEAQGGEATEGGTETHAVPGLSEERDLGTSIVLQGPGGYVMFGVLNTPFVLGQA